MFLQFWNSLLLYEKGILTQPTAEGSDKTAHAQSRQSLKQSQMLCLEQGEVSDQNIDIVFRLDSNAYMYI